MRIKISLFLSFLAFLIPAFAGILPYSSGSRLPDGFQNVSYPLQLPPAPNDAIVRPNSGIQFLSTNVTASENSVWRGRGIPAGLTLSPLGILSGKPTRIGNYTFTISVFVRPLTRNGTSVLDLRDSGNYTLTVNSTPPPTITSSRVLPGAKFDRPYVFVANNGHSLKAQGGYPFLQNSRYPTGYYWQHLPKRDAFQRLPQGMTLNSNGVISGTPVWPKPPVPLTPQTYTIEARATDFLGKFSSANFTLVVQPPEGPEIITECPLPSGLEKDRYPVVELKARKGKPTYRWPKPINLPPGLVWSEKGFISGTPSVYGNFTIDLRVIDANGLTANKTCLIVIRPAPELDCPNIPCARVGDTLLPVRLAARGGDLPYSFSATNPPFVSGAPSTLPPGLSINATTGIISGNFTGGGNLTYNATYTVRDNANRTANKTCPIVVKDRLSITTASPLPFGIRGFPYPGKTGAPTVSINATGGWPPYNFQRVAGLLPDGLSINPNTGVISGTPTKTGTFKFTIRVKDSCETPPGWVDKEFEISIYDPITVFPQPGPCLTVNRTFSLPHSLRRRASLCLVEFHGEFAELQPLGSGPQQHPDRARRWNALPSRPGLFHRECHLPRPHRNLHGELHRASRVENHLPLPSGGGHGRPRLHSAELPGHWRHPVGKLHLERDCQRQWNDCAPAGLECAPNRYQPALHLDTVRPARGIHRQRGLQRNRPLHLHKGRRRLRQYRYQKLHGHCLPGIELQPVNNFALSLQWHESHRNGCPSCHRRQSPLC